MADEKAEQQANAEIDPRPDREEEQVHGWLRNPSVFGPAVQDGAPPQSDVVTRVGRSVLAPANTWPGRDGRKRPHYTSGESEIVSLRTP